MLKHSIFIFLLISNFIWGQSLDLQIETSKNLYNFGEFVDMEIVVINNSDQEIKIPKPGLADGAAKLHFITPSGEEYPYKGVVLGTRDGYLVNPGDSIDFSIILNENFGEHIVPWKRGIYVFPAGKYKLYAEMFFDGEKMISNTIFFEVKEMSSIEKNKFDEFKAYLNSLLDNRSTLAAEKITEAFNNSDEGFRHLALTIISVNWKISLKEPLKGAELAEKIVLEYPDSFDSIRHLRVLTRKGQKKELIPKVSKLSKNTFYTKYYNKLLKVE